MAILYKTKFVFDFIFFFDFWVQCSRCSMDMIRWAHLKSKTITAIKGLGICSGPYFILGQSTCEARDPRLVWPTKMSRTLQPLFLRTLLVGMM